MARAYQSSNLGESANIILQSLKDLFDTKLLLYVAFCTIYIFNLVTYLIVEPYVQCLGGSMYLFTHWMLLIGYHCGLITDDTMSGKSIIDLDDLSAFMETVDQLLGTYIYIPVLLWESSILTWLCSSETTGMSVDNRSVVQRSNAAVESDQIPSSVESSRTSMCSRDSGHQETFSPLFQKLFGYCQ